MLSLVGRELICCGCGRPQPQHGPNPLVGWLRAHGLTLLGVVMLVPLGIGIGMLDELQMATEAHAGKPAAPERVQERQP